MSRGTFCFRLIFVFIIAAVFCITVPSSFAAESGSIKGVVLDKVANDPLIGAKVVVLNTNLVGFANFDGVVTIYGVPAGQHSLEISYIGYQTITIEVTIPENGIMDQKFLLAPLAIEGTEVVIDCGQPRGQLAAINAQLMANNIVDVMSSEKMKELPDANIAESVGRLPGITLQRDAGEANAVVVRGLSPKYNSVTIEGVAMNSTNYLDRGIDLSMIGSEMVKGVEVSKTLRPDIDADALGGTVNITLKTAQEDLHCDLRAYGGYTELNNSYNNYKFTGTVSDRFFDNKFGVILQGSLEQKMLPSDQFDALYEPPLGAKLANGDTVENMSTSSATVRQTKTTRNRYGASVILDYASDLVDVKFFTMYNQKKDSSITRSNQSSFLISQFYYQIFANVTRTEQRTHSLQFLFKLGKTELPISVSYTRGDVRSPNDQQIDIYGYQGDPNYQPLRVTQTNFVQPSVLMNYMGVQQPENSLFQQMYKIQNTLVDQAFNVKADWKVPFRLLEDLSGILSVGGKYHSEERHSNHNQYGLYWVYGAGQSARTDLIAYLDTTYPGFRTDPTIQTGILADNFIDPNYKGGNILGYPIGQQYDVYKLLSINNAFWSIHGPQTENNDYCLDGIDSYNQDYIDKEKTSAAYIMGEFNIGSDLTVIPGVRFQEHKSDISAYHILVDVTSRTGIYTGILGNPILYQYKKTSPNWFPSVNIKYKATENIQILGAAYRSVSLPSYTDLSPVVIFNSYGIFLPNSDRIQIQSGNPLLKPATAMNFDLGVSVFNNNIGLFTVNLFYKEISNLIYSMQNYQPFLTSPVIGGPADLMSRLPAAAYFDTSFAKLTTGLLSTNIPMNNPEKAYLRGIELSWQTHMWYLPWVFSGIVLDFNASFMSSNQLYPYFKTVRTGGTLIRPIYSMVYNTKAGQLQDQPKAIYNAILGWDYEGFSSRFSFRYQQTTLTSLDTRYSLRDAYYDNVLLVDISVKQQILDNLAIFASVTNVNSHIDNYYLNYYNGNNGTSGRLPTSEQAYGMNAQLGLSYSY